jgi:hypothetical protein
VDYELHRLSARDFEHVTQALVLKALGARVEVFGDGPDGGREASCRGEMRWSPSEQSDLWNGYAVVQAKFRARPLGTAQDTAWFIAQLRVELDHWLDPRSNRRKQGELPEYLLVVTNVVLSPGPGGGVDEVDGLLAEYSERLGLKGAKKWHFDKICRLLDDAADIRSRYSGLIAVGDIFEGLRDLLQGTAAQLGPALAEHAAKDLIADRAVRLDQAGSPDNQRIQLAGVGTDLRALIRSADPDAAPRAVSAASHVIEHADSIWRPSLRDPHAKPHVVLVGGPGQGKTTLGQLIAQAYRVALLESSATQGDVRRTIEATKNWLGAIGLPTPKSLRWPIRVSLPAFGDAISGGGDTSLIRWIAGEVTRRGSVDVKSSQLAEWFKNWPWLLLDGLDEVPAMAARDRLVQRLHDFLTESAVADADLVIVGTTRPQGYSGEFAPEEFTHLHLDWLTAEEAVTHARLVTAARLPDDQELQIAVVERARAAAKESLTARLMRTPLQVTIMSLLLEKRARPPQDRHGLFEAYYDTIYAREAAKTGFLAVLLDDRRGDIHAVHEAAGLQPQILAETAGDAEAVLSRAQLRDLVVQRLVAEGNDQVDTARLVEQITAATMDRLVLLTPQGREGVGFEVRSLQEYMAARALVGRSDDEVIEALRITARSAHWRNTWLLAGGRIFTQERLRQRLLDLLEHLDTADDLSVVIPPGPELASDLLDDDIAARSPLFRRRLLLRALRILELPPGDGTTLLSVLEDLGGDETLRPHIKQAFDAALKGPPGPQQTARLAATILRRRTGELAAYLRRVVPTPSVVEVAPRGRVAASNLLSALDHGQLSTDSRFVVDRFVSEIRRDDDGVGGGAALQVLEDPEAGTAVALALLTLNVEHWESDAYIRRRLAQAAKRRPVGPALVQSG